jgi:hypothetical protein
MVQHIKNNPEIVRSGFRETGISDTLAESLEDEVPLSTENRQLCNTWDTVLHVILSCLILICNL